MTEAYFKVVLIVFVLVSLQMQAMLVCGSTCHNVSASVAQSAALPSGSLLENVVCRANSEQSYSLYLPTNYTPQRKWPILYAFDPAARGVTPVQRFQVAAEKYGWIIVGSNNSKNGPNKVAVDAFEAMWQDTHGRFAIDDRRVYATGFSGGARVAVGLAATCEGCIAGVISSGAGFHSQVAVSQKLSFIFFAAVGTDDFNFPEVKELETKLVKAGVTHRLVVFSGDHEWLSAELGTEAIEWMELQAMKAGRREKDPLMIESFWQAHLTAARASEDAGQQYAAYRRYQTMSQDFSGLKDLAAISAKATQLREARDVKRSIGEEKDEINKQRELENRIHAFLGKRRVPEYRLTAGADMRTAIDSLSRQAKESQDTSQRRVARRVIRSLLVSAYEQADRSLRAADYADAVFNFDITTEIAPDNPRLFFELACAYALAGQKGRALQALRKAVEKGFSNLESITTNRALDSLRGDAVYMELVKLLQKKP